MSGQELAWFFDGLVYGDGILNYTVTGVDEHTVTVARQGELAIPTEVSVTFADGSAAREPWNGKEETLTLVYDDRPPVQAAEVDPDHRLVIDLRWWDNGLSRQAELGSWAAFTSRLFYDIQNLLLVLGGW